MAEMDKVTRILLMYSQISQGKKIYKKSFCLETGINRRTFDRDIEDIRLYLSESFDGSNLIYDRTDESYHLETYYKTQPITAMEAVFLLELLKSACVLREDEYAGITAGLLNATEINRRGDMKKIMGSYHSENTTALLKMNWDLQQCIMEKDKIELQFQHQKRQTISPVGIYIYQQEMFLFAYDASETLQAILVKEILSFKMKNQKYDKRLSEKFSKLQKAELKQVIRRNTDEED